MATRREIPSSLIEIGRLREQAFRAVHEGTGQPFDLDMFDQHYVHLFLWNTTRHEIVGSYRLGRVDDILRNRAPTVFTQIRCSSSSRDFWNDWGRRWNWAAHSSGRNTKARPRRCRFCGGASVSNLVRNAECKILFGPVSISQAYAGLSRRLMVEFLSGCAGAMSLRRW